MAVLTAVDLLGFGPTVRKAYADPHAESLTFFALFMVRNLIVVAALESRSLTTVLFPAAVAAACALLIALIVYRRRVRPRNLGPRGARRRDGPRTPAPSPASLPPNRIS